MGNLNFTASPIEESEDLFFAAQTTAAQFLALAQRLERKKLTASIPSWLAQPLRFKRAKHCELAEVERWIRNAWNTERVLRAQLELDEDGKRFALQWAFAQAYYAVFCQVLAFFHAHGATERSHATVLKKFGELVREGRFPPELSCHADGGMNAIKLSNVTVSSGSIRSFQDLLTTPSEDEIAGFLRATRKKQLNAKKPDHKLKTTSGKAKTSFSKADWDAVSRALGPTTILSLLYRKRLKANYDSIDTFLDPSIDGDGIMRSLVAIVDSMALVLEAAQHRVIGKDHYSSFTTRARQYPFVHERLAQFSAGRHATAVTNPTSTPLLDSHHFLRTPPHE
ncbi:MAG: hypothetical protein MUC36_02135 [Planctomycetes bacterium]|jgi:hypothetical protein|nr:hypothetical protein [Planctomycetota bacterium]